MVENISMLKYIGGSLFIFAILLGILIYVKKSQGLFSKYKHAKRLHVTNVLPLDPKNRLVLIKRDGIEHLILLGANQNIVIEKNINLSSENITHFKKIMTQNDEDEKKLKA